MLREEIPNYRFYNQNLREIIKDFTAETQRIRGESLEVSVFLSETRRNLRVSAVKNYNPATCVI